MSASFALLLDAALRAAALGVTVALLLKLMRLREQGNRNTARQDQGPEHKLRHSQAQVK